MDILEIHLFPEQGESENTFLLLHFTLLENPPIDNTNYI